MANELLISKTKILLPPRRKELLSRTRLLDLLSDLLDFRLIIVAAPAGYGKTSLLTDFAHQFDWPVCWFSLDSLDSDPHRFLSHFVMSIKQQFPEFGDEAINILKTTPADQLNLDFLISVMTNDIYEKITEHFIIVLDDYYLLNSSDQIDTFLSDFIQRADDNCHIAITSRKLLTLPDLPLMVARAQVGGLSIEELVFQPDEIQKLYNQVFHQEINVSEAEEIASASEGWITGLLLTSPLLRSGMGEPIKIARASGIGLYEYLAQQVLTQQPENIQAFLLNSSILEEFNAEMCEAVIGKALNQKEDWRRLMDAIFHNNLFVLPVDDEYKWLRYHHLFRDFLRATLENQRPQDAKILKLKLACYFSEKEDWEKVFDIYQHLGNTDAIAALVEKVGSVFISKGKISKLAAWLQLIPPEKIASNPKLLSIQAAIHVNQGHIQQGKDLLDSVVINLRKSDQKINLADNLIRRSSALRILGQYNKAMKDVEEAISLVSGKRGSESLFSEALRVKGFILFQTGNFKESLDVYLESLKICEREKNEEDAARILVEIGAAYERLGQFSAAERAYEKSLAYWQSSRDSIWVPTILNNLGVLQHSNGEFLSSFHNLEKAMHYSQITGNQHMEGYALASIGDLYKDLDAFDEAFDAYKKSLDIARNVEDQYLIFYLKTASARLAINQKQLLKAETQIRDANAIAEKSSTPFETHKTMLEACALDFALNKNKSVQETINTIMEYFLSKGHIEDGIRAHALNFLSLIKLGETKKALSGFKTFIAGINDPDKYIPSLVIINEHKEFIKRIAAKKEYSSLISTLLIHLNDFKKLTQKSRRQIRKEASVVPFAPAKIEIRAFGRSEVTVKNQIVAISDWKTQTSRDLFFLFLAHPQGLTKEEVGEIMWQDLSPSELKLRFKNAIYRMRHAIGSEVVHFQDNFYQFNRSVDYEYDVHSFLNATIIAREETAPEKKIEAYMTAIEFYKGPYLVDIDYSWVMPDRQRYQDLVISNILELVKLLVNIQDFDQGLDYCRRALKEDTCNEEIHRLIMEIYALMGNKAAISRQYQQCMKFLNNEIGAAPSEATTNLYNQLIK